MLGLHVHLGSQVADATARALDGRAAGRLCTEARAKLGWTPAIVNLGGGLGIRYVLDEPEPPTPGGVRAVGVGAALRRLVGRRPAEAAADLRAGPLARRPGRGARCTASASSSAAARRPGSRSTVACPTIPARRCTARAIRRCVANRADEPPTGTYAVCGKHCESGDVLIERAELAEPAPRRRARDPGDRRVRPLDGVELQRRLASVGRARPGRSVGHDPGAARTTARNGRVRVRLGPGGARDANRGSRRRPRAGADGDRELPRWSDRPPGGRAQRGTRHRQDDALGSRSRRRPQPRPPRAQRKTHRTRATALVRRALRSVRRRGEHRALGDARASTACTRDRSPPR